MEKDEESGLSRHGVRMYATWLGRWTSADPSGTQDGLNRFAYTRGNPIRLLDPTGRGGWAGIYEAVQTWDENTISARFQKSAMTVLAGAGRGADVVVDAVFSHPTETAKSVYGASPLGQATTAYGDAGGGVTGLLAGKTALEYANSKVAAGMAIGTVKTGVDATLLLPRSAELTARIVTGDATPMEKARAAVGGAVGLTDGRVSTLEEQTVGVVESAGAAATVALGAGAPASFSKPSMPGGGTLTAGEVGEIQAIANRYGTRIDVVGSRATGTGRNLSTNLPHGKGAASRSDIDFRIAADHPQVSSLIADLRAVGNNVGTAGPEWASSGGLYPRPTVPPFIRFQPGKSPYLLPKPPNFAVGAIEMGAYGELGNTALREPELNYAPH